MFGVYLFEGLETHAYILKVGIMHNDMLIASGIQNKTTVFHFAQEMRNGLWYVHYSLREVEHMRSRDIFVE